MVLKIYMIFGNQDIINYLNEFKANKTIINLASNEYLKVIKNIKILIK